MFAMKLDAEAEDIGFAMGDKDVIEQEMGIDIETIEPVLQEYATDDNKPVYVHINAETMIDALPQIIMQYESGFDDLDDPSMPDDPIQYKRLAMELSLLHEARRKIEAFVHSL